MTRKMVNVTRKSGPHATLILQVVMGPGPCFWKAQRSTLEEGPKPDFLERAYLSVTFEGYQKSKPGIYERAQALACPELTFKARFYRAQPIPNCRSHNEKSSCY